MCTIRWCGILLSLGLLAASVKAQSTYYVSAVGQDTNDGKSVATPFRTVSRVNGLVLKPGDAVLFRRGETFRGTLTIRQAGAPDKPIRIDAYGTGERPLLSGAVPLTNWTSLGNNRWQASFPDGASRVTGLYRNGLPLPLGRYPNASDARQGFLTVQEHVGTSQLISQQALTTNWVGGEVVVRPTHWIIDRAPITAQAGNTLFLGNKSTYDLTNGWGYFIQNHPATLDQNGEWYYNPANKTVQLYLTENPAGQVLTVTAFDDGINIADAAHISIQNIQITQTRSHNLYVSNVSSLTLASVDITNAGEDGITFVGDGRDVSISQIRMADINNNAVNIGTYQNVTFRNSTIRNVGLQPGRGKSGDGQFCGIQSHGENILIEGNVIDSVGYNGVSIGNNTTVRRNLIRNFCAIKSDGGGIYLWNGLKLPMSNIRIQGNTIRGGIGTTSGTADTVFSGAHGIFLDDCVTNVEVLDNTVADCQGMGLAMHGVSNVTLLRNIAFNNQIGQMNLYTYTGNCVPRSNIIRQNMFVARGSAQPVVGYLSTGDDLPAFGDFDHNYYVRPSDDVLTIGTVYNGNIVSNMALTQWQDRFQHDLFSHTSPLGFAGYQVQNLSPASRIDDAFGQQIGGWDSWSSRDNGRVGWESSGQLDGGSMKVTFPAPSPARDSYLLLYKQMQSVVKGKSYLLRFDAVTAGVSQQVSVYMRRRNAPYTDLVLRSTRLITTARQRHEIAFTATDSEVDALLAFQIQENGQPIWFDNIRLQEATIRAVSPDDYMQLVSNPTARDSTFSLPGNYRDLRSRAYGNQITLAPYRSVVLLRDSLPAVDVSLSMQPARPTVRIDETTTVSVMLRSTGGTISQVGNRVQWACRLPAGLTLADTQGLLWRDSTVVGTVQRLNRDTTFTFRVRATRLGAYQLAAQVTATTYADPNSSSDSGTDDNENDMARISLNVVDKYAADTAGIVTATEPLLPAVLNVVYPNPSTGSFTFIADGDLQQVRLIDLVGREWARLGTARRDQPIQFGDQLPAGQYILRLQYSTGDTRTVKLIKAPF